MYVMFSGLLVADGGLGLEMIKRGLDIKNDPLWSAKGLIYYPNEIKDIHKSFLKSGANIILTASYQASIDGLCHYTKCSESEAMHLIQKSVVLAKQACAEFLEERKHGCEFTSCDRLLIGGSVGPYGACLGDLSEYNGNYIDNMKMEEIISWHKTRLKILVEAGVDFLAVETIPSLMEAEVILSVIKEFPNTPCWVTFSCKDDKETCHGEAFYDAVTKVATYDQVEAVGVNCCPPYYIKDLLCGIKENVKKPLVVCPNVNEFAEHYPLPHVTDTKDSSQSTVQQNNDVNDKRLERKSASLASFVPEWLELGAEIIGGCCGAGPSDIQAIRKAVTDWKSTN